MNIDQQYILVIEDEPLLSMIYTDLFEDTGFKIEPPSYNLAQDGWEVHFAATKSQAADFIKRFAYEAVFLDHNLDGGQNSASLVPTLLRNSPLCQIILAGSNPDQQRPAVEQALKDAGMDVHIPCLKSHTKSDTTGFTNFINSLIRSTSGSNTQTNRNLPRSDI